MKQYLFCVSLSLPGTIVRKSGSAAIINSSDSSMIGKNESRISAANRNQLEPSPHELPVKDTDHVTDIANVECEYIKIIIK